MKAPAWFGARRARAAWVRGSGAEGTCPELIVLCGPSHSGKSTFARQHLGSCRIVSTDRIRKELGARFVRFEAEPEVWRAFTSITNDVKDGHILVRNMRGGLMGQISRAAVRK